MTIPSYDHIDWTITRTAAEWTELADQLTAAAEGRERQSAESFERCDTDGFLSQWASGVTAGAYHLAAIIARRGGRIERKALFTLDGQFVTAELVDSRYGMSWMIPRRTAARLGTTKRFVTYSQAKTPGQASGVLPEERLHRGNDPRGALRDFAWQQRGQRVRVRAA